VEVVPATVRAANITGTCDDCRIARVYAVHMLIPLDPLAAGPSSSNLPPIFFIGAACCLLAVAGVAAAIWLIVRASRRKAQPSPPIVTTAHPQAWPAAPVDVADQLRRLADLRDTGVLTEEEFQAQKRRLLGT
jgi:hypothetical protein